MQHISILRFLFWICFFHFSIILQGQAWKEYHAPEDAGWSSEKLGEAWAFADSIGSAAFILIHDGKIVSTYGDVTRRFMCHSVRKSLLTTLYGIYVDKGLVDLDQTLAELGIDDVHSLTDLEKTATIRQLLQARSGVYHPAAYETESMKKARPARGSHAPGTFWYYNNWDFNTSCAILMQQTGEDFFSDFKNKIADPLGMEDFRLEDTYYHLEAEHSKYPAYPFRMSARDLARVGQLYLQGGRWDGRQLITGDWIREATKTYSSNTRTEGRGYAYMWWTNIYGEEHPNYSMQGVGNQAVIVFPEDNVVMVNRADTYLGRPVKTEDLVQLTKLVWAARGGTRAPMPRQRKARFEKSQPPIPSEKMKPRRLRSFTGKYQLDEAEIDIAVKDKHLFVSTPVAGDFYAVPVGTDALMLQDAWYILHFVRGGDGKFEQKIQLHRDPAEYRQ